MSLKCENDFTQTSAKKALPPSAPQKPSSLLDLQPDERLALKPEDGIEYICLSQPGDNKGLPREEAIVEKYHLRRI